MRTTESAFLVVLIKSAVQFYLCKHVIVGQFKIDECSLSTLKKAHNSHQFLFILRGWGLGMKVGNEALTSHKMHLFLKKNSELSSRFSKLPVPRVTMVYRHTGKCHRIIIVMSDIHNGKNNKECMHGAFSDKLGTMSPL